LGENYLTRLFSAPSPAADYAEPRRRSVRPGDEDITMMMMMMMIIIIIRSSPDDGQSGRVSIGVEQS